MIDAGIERCIDGPPFVKHKAFAFKMGVTILFKVLQDAAIELVNIRYAGFLHQDGGLFAANATGAKADDRLALELPTVRQLAKRLGAGSAFLDVKILKTRIGAQPGQKIMNFAAPGGQKQVDAFFCQ